MPKALVRIPALPESIKQFYGLILLGEIIPIIDEKFQIKYIYKVKDAKRYHSNSNAP